MNQLNPDLEANLIDEDDYYEDDRSPLEIPHPEAAEVSQQNPLQAGANDFDASPRFNAISLLVSFAKIIASTVVLLTMPNICTSLSQIWVFCMLLHDTLNIVTIIMRLKNIYAIRSLSATQTEPQEQVEPENGEQNNVPHELQGFDSRLEEQGEEESEIEIQQQEEVNHEELLETAKILNRMRRIKVLTHVCLWFWSALFVTGICLNAFMDLTTCQTPETNRLLLAYLIMAGIWLFSPVLLLVVGCVCLPVLLVLVWLVGRPKPANSAAIKKLPVIKYSSNVPGEKECVICMIEYQEGDKLVQLRCNAMHHFHEKCGKKWLKINGQCPMCRERIDQKTQNPESQNEESESD